ncbi:uncharacterized protein LOC142224040 isoform X2 [Haematobia irritans]|uniref:uncharacterized protein LOC142224040 isoform X2 n=1 Tax=Haematobia irritans TaxID=7368 RepID=UPI003F5075C0
MVKFENIFWLNISFGNAANSMQDGSQPIIEFIKPPTDKRLELFDFIANKINDWSTKQLIIEGSSYETLLAGYNEFLDSHKGDKSFSSAPYQKLKQQIERFIQAIEKLKKDSQSCILQAKASQELEEISKNMEFLNTSPNNNTALVNLIRRRYNEATTKMSQEFSIDLKEIYERLPTIIYNFKQNLSPAEREEYKELLRSCDEFLPSANSKKKYEVFEKFTKFILRGLHVKGRSESNCKWESSRFVEFPQKINSWAVGN